MSDNGQVNLSVNDSMQGVSYSMSSMHLALVMNRKRTVTGSAGPSGWNRSRTPRFSCFSSLRVQCYFWQSSWLRYTALGLWFMYIPH